MEDITEEDLKAALESPDTSAEEFLTCTKMLCAKDGMTHSELEGIFLKQETRSKDRQIPLYDHT